MYTVNEYSIGKLRSVYVYKNIIYTNNLPTSRSFTTNCGDLVRTFRLGVFIIIEWYFITVSKYSCMDLYEVLSANSYKPECVEDS